MDYVVCPYNTEHKVRGTELRMHLMTCESNKEKQQDRPTTQQTAKKKQWVAISLMHEKEEEKRRMQQMVNVYDSENPDKLLQCPYDSNHQIRACRFPYHLIKCRKNHEALASQFVTCPFNARHIIPRGELSFHISRCDDKGSIEQAIADEKSLFKRNVSPSRWNSPPCEENWDEDLESNRSAFLWGTPSWTTPSSGGGMDLKNGLGPNLRAPKSVPFVLPWKVHNKP